MKKFIFLICALMLVFSLNAQTWESRIQTVSGKPVVKTIKIKEGVSLNTGKVLNDSYSLQENRYCYGTFLGGTADSLKFKLTEVRTNKSLPDGTRILTTVPGKIFLNVSSSNPGTYAIALSDIDYLNFGTRKKGIGENFEILLWSSFAALILSPFICINYKEGTFNAERYQYWALGGTAGIVSSVAIGIIFSSKNKKFQFHPDWPMKKAKVWKFIP